ncbi:protein turtle homolog B-like [Saccostrea echinata]|uniref:protein turtle homolog B-like n=1 Tax=Saccostrea echinata TaxID=191078 RepID=UPI002A8315BB|nr:protein turtle homolog B-like [Saccostrea echinata]
MRETTKNNLETVKMLWYSKADVQSRIAKATGIYDGLRKSGVALQYPAYVKQGSPGCLNISISGSIPEDFVIFLRFNKSSICNLAGIPGSDPFIDINKNYRGRITCNVDTSMNRVYICFTTSVNTTDAGVYFAELTISSVKTNNTLFVMTPPSKPTINVNGIIISNTVHNLTCSALSTSMPMTGLPITYVWTVNDANITDSRFKITGQGGDVLTINQVKKQDKGTIVQCIAKEEKGLLSEPSNEETLDVLYIPEIYVTPSTNIAAKLGDSNLQFKCIVDDANPSTGLNYRWTKGGYQISTNQTYIISTVRKSDQGTFQCTAGNSVGTSIPSTINVEVVYIPEIENFTIVGGRVVNELSRFIMVCIVNSPRPANITLQNGNTSEVVSRGYGVFSLNFTENSAQCFQTAVYICLAQNVIGISESTSLELYVRCKPRSVNGLFFQQMSTNKLQISATYIAYPIPSIQWTFRKSSTSAEKYISSNFWNTAIITATNISTFSVNYNKDSLQTDEFGYYTANVRNDQGSFLATFLIMPEGIPDTPRNMSVICSIAGTAFVSWIPGSDGGVGQIFILSYKKATAPQAQLNTSIISGISVIIPNLENELYTFTLIALNKNGESAPVQDACQIQKLDKECGSLTSVFGSLFGIFLLICIGLLTFIIVTKCLQSRDISCGEKKVKNPDYVMEDITKDEDHQYSDVAKETGEGVNQEQTSRSQYDELDSYRQGNVYAKVVGDHSDNYMNTT